MIVESAFMLPFLFALLFGIIDFGFAFNDWISVRQGGRDGLRQAIVNTKPATPSAACSASITPSAASFTTDAQDMICYTKTRIGLDLTKTRVKMFFTAPYTANSPVKICVQYQTSSMTGAYATLLNGRILDTEVESLIEQSQPATFVPFEETAFTTWSPSCNSL